MTKVIASVGRMLLAASCVMALPATASAQDGQTAEGAQAFLAAMAKRGLARATFIDALGRANHVTGTYEVKTSRIWLSLKEEASSKPVERSLGEIVVAGLASGDLSGAPDACTTRITGVKAPANLQEFKVNNWEEPGFGVSVSVSRTETWNYGEGFSAFSGEHAIDWRQAKVVRSNDGSRVDISVPGQKFTTNILSFVPGDSELGDRIEYAAKFLRMSCDEIAATGF